jgi:16S rRNA (cytosine967-C5)-methyltransferase
VLDVCAAPGGKTIQLAQAVGETGRVLAVDIQANRLRLVQENAERLGQGHVEIVARDARDVPAEWEKAFDVVLLDAPCSGLGVLAKRADMRWRRDLANLDELVTLQKELMEAAATCVREGGLLLYSTCTIEPAENSEQVDSFLQHHPEFARESAPEGFPGEWLTDEGDYLSLPFESGMDGAYAARLRRSN